MCNVFNEPNMFSDEDISSVTFKRKRFRKQSKKENRISIWVPLEITWLSTLDTSNVQGIRVIVFPEE